MPYINTRIALERTALCSNSRYQGKIQGNFKRSITDHRIFSSKDGHFVRFKRNFLQTEQAIKSAYQGI
jgi:hypothetical protein